MGCRLRELRIKRGLNQTGLAMILNVSQQTISRIEAGISEIPIDLAVQAAKYFRVSVDYILGLSDERNNTTGIRKDIYMASQHEDFLIEYAKLDKSQKRAIEYLIKGLSETQKEQETLKKNKSSPN